MSSIDIVETRVRGFISDIQHPKQKKKINVNDLELQLRRLLDNYFEMNGYQLFYEAMEKLHLEGVLSPIQNKQYNGKSPALPLYYWVNTKAQETKWDRLKMMRLSDKLDFSYYERHPEYQTKEEWERIEKLYLFLQTAEEREVVSVEERSLELFGHEKFLQDSDLFPEGKGFLTRIGIPEEKLKMVKYGEPFVFWLKQGREIKDIQRVLIVENLAFFHTSIRLLEENMLDYEPELIIYGEGMKIERSFSFFFQLFPPKNYLFYYAGDLDAEGYGIIFRLMGKFPGTSIQPALKIYRKMLQFFEQRNDQNKRQTQNTIYRDAFFQWFTEEEQELLQQLWQENKRIPQEVLTIETWRRLL
ncbi:Wadjet anti-phage system protein JetD domain-containing protein [Paucisalibacillus globulus]|uniref:Wadjet anti-phage system protein JetD domain-containing protein n=1 Tax=Paucisalibacillus globulus TaxID=351095 RepID=UPI00047C2B5A|nr:Wadjet anti-phage system protein JetD domain-containing protein [Paucisalibacillus globulus]